MSKNIMVLFIIILLIVGGIGIYNYNQANQAKKEMEEKCLQLEKNNEIILQLKESIKEKEKQIEELKEDLTKEKKDLQEGYADKLSALMEEKTQLETLLAEKEKMWLDKNKEKEQSIIKLEEEISGYKENISSLDNEIINLKEEVAKLNNEKENLEEDYAKKLSTLTEEKNKLGSLLAQKEEAMKIMEKQKEEYEQEVHSKDEVILELRENLTEFEQQKGKFEKNIAERDKTIGDLSINIKEYQDQINELREQLAQKEKEKEKECTDKLSLVLEEKNKLETELAQIIEKTKPNYYEVKKGDSLWKIAERFYHQGEQWIKIFEANIEKIKNPDLIYPYQRFAIPKE